MSVGYNQILRKIPNKITRKKEFREALSVLVLIGLVYFGFRGSMILAMGTTSPMTGVTGDSMTHPDDSWKNFYTEKGYEISDFPLKGGLQQGDLVVVKGLNSVKDTEIGDVVIWRDEGKRIIHRVAVIKSDSKGPYLKTRSDKYQVLDYNKIRSDDLVGKAVFSIPYLGYPATWF